jgi:hypothetical protein
VAMGSCRFNSGGRLMLISYTNQILCHGRGCFLATHEIDPLRAHVIAFGTSTRDAAIKVAWLRTSSGRTVTSGRAVRISSVVGDIKSFSM